MSKYEVKSVVCDYGVFENNELKLICNSHANALKIKEILETDSDMSKPYVWQDKTIADLEAKLAQSKMNESFEKEKKENAWKFIEQLKHQLTEYEKFMKDNGFKNLEELDSYIQKIHSHYDEVKNKGTCGLCEKLDNELINQLKQQLTEKDRQIEQLKKFDDLNKTFFDLFRTAFKEPNKVDDLFNTLKTMQEKQDQDKISFCVEKLVNIQKYITDNAVFVEEECFGREINEFIDNQIEELKKENTCENNKI